ncbi:MAG: transcription-repair coupling factor [Vicinamibacterales bacterium]
MTTATSLALRAFFKSALGRLETGVPGYRPGRARRITGLTPAAQTLYVAGAARDGLTILVAATDRDVERMASDTRFFLSALDGLAEADAERLVLPFPSHEIDPYRGLAPHFEVSSARARALHAIAAGQARIVVASVAALLPRVSAPERSLAFSIDLTPGVEIDPQALGDLLVEAGYTRQDPVDQHGEFCVRGGVVDFYPAGDAQPVRVEFIGDTIESIRRYDAATQRSIAPLDRLAVVPLRERFEDAMPSATFYDYVARAGGVRLFVAEPEDAAAQARKVVEQVRASFDDARAKAPEVRHPEPQALFTGVEEVEAWLSSGTALEELAVEDGGDEARHIACQPVVEFRGRVADWVAEIRHARERGETVLFVADSAGRAERALELLREYDVVAVPVEHTDEAHTAAVFVATGHLSRGFRLPEAGLVIYAETDVLDEARRVHERRKSAARTFLSDFRDLKVGDHVVHVDHGIGMFVGLKRIQVGGSERAGPPGQSGRDGAQEFMELRYAGDDKLFVPIERLDLVQKYTGGAKPALDRLGGTTWERAKTRVRKAMRDMAEELLKLYAARKAVAGHAFAADSHWQREFDEAFEWELTPDQQAAVGDIKRDMETPSPMDRLLCGDVGYGKTEVAMRAAFKSVMDGKQVAVLAPTTVLAFQHLKTLRDRFAGFPVTIEMASRFRSKPEQKQILADLAAGRVDIIVGTHRLLSKDVTFRDLGLLVVDEEQRFGVAHKEKIKQLRKRVDVLTMTATPIPRTLNMSLVGIRDMSIIETPPKDRLAIQTSVVKFDRHVIARAISNELERGGQVYFVHNRVESIYSLGNLLTRIVPEARIGIAHGQMSEDALERVMVDFVAHTHDVLLATTIIENGLDIPNANTMIVNRADRYGLAQLYQLRGRVGRSDRRAYAYLLIPPEESLSAVARKRLAAIREFSDLGSGFRVAALDLEIRGAGNLLGGEQSGHIEAVGFDMYMKLLEQTVRELRGEELEEERRASVNLRVDLRIDDGFIPDMNQRLTVYRRIAGVRTEDELVKTVEEIRDRYGPVPASLLNLADYARIRLLADRLGVESLDRDGQVVVLKFRQDANIDAAALIRMVRARNDVKLAPPASLKLDLRGARPDVRRSGSWWTARATAGEVAPGFTREEMTRAPETDPRARDGLFERLGSLLDELSRPP